MEISIKGNQETNEYQDALQLKKIFEASAENREANGKILIISNATLFGQETKDLDLIVVGNFDKLCCEVKTAAIGPNDERLERENRRVFVRNFCFVIESKAHRAEDIRLDGLNLLVRYNGKMHDATAQSEKQKYSLKRFFLERANFSPYIANFIWLRNVSGEALADLTATDSTPVQHNYLPNSFTFQQLLELACVQQPPYNAIDENGEYRTSTTYNALKTAKAFDFGEIDSIFSIFEKVKDGAGQMTRRKVEQITSRLLDDQQYAQAIGKKLVVISGRAGTGKTIKLLRIACDLAKSKGARSLVLTYNHALVSDLKRTLALANVSDGIDNSTIQISTLHKYVYDLVLGFGLRARPIGDNEYIPDFLDNYQEYVEELIQFIDNGLIREPEIQELIKANKESILWDYVLIDESQDWREFEKELIFKLFGKNKTIITDGIDQLVRTQQKCDWTKGLTPDLHFKKTYEKKGLRQQVNLVKFVNEYATQAGINWDIEPKEELLGGKIIISTKGYSKELHTTELAHCKKCQNTEYEMMFLVPPNLVTRSYGVDDSGYKIESRQFAQTEQFSKMGINLWDLTKSETRSQYVVDLNLHRLLQYDSCRGLEAWTVVCLNFDDFVSYKLDSFKEELTQELALESIDEKKNKFAYLWSLMPLTRTIDTLVITLRNEKSEVGQILRKTQEKYPDFIHWID